MSCPVQQLFPWWLFPELRVVLERWHLPGTAGKHKVKSVAGGQACPTYKMSGHRESPGWAVRGAYPALASLSSVSLMQVFVTLLVLPSGPNPKSAFFSASVGKSPWLSISFQCQRAFLDSSKKWNFFLPFLTPSIPLVLFYAKEDWLTPHFDSEVGMGNILPFLAIQFHSLYHLI